MSRAQLADAATFGCCYCLSSVVSDLRGITFYMHILKRTKNAAECHASALQSQTVHPFLQLSWPCARLGLVTGEKIGTIGGA